MNSRHAFPGGSVCRYDRSARRPGFRSSKRPNWDWIPEEYLWTPTWYGEEDDWDEPRGGRHAKSSRKRGRYSRRGSSFTPRTGMGRRASDDRRVHQSHDAYYDDDLNRNRTAAFKKNPPHEFQRNPEGASPKSPSLSRRCRRTGSARRETRWSGPMDANHAKSMTRIRLQETTLLKATRT